MIKIVERIMEFEPEYLGLTADEIAQVKAHLKGSKEPVSLGRLQRDPEYRRRHEQRLADRRFLEAVLAYNLEKPKTSRSKGIGVANVQANRRILNGVKAPRTITWHGAHHDCELTSNESDFLKVALRKREVNIRTLMNTENGLVWKEHYTSAKRIRISQFLSRLNSKLLKATPPLRVSFNLRRSNEFISRTDPSMTIR